MSFVPDRLCVFVYLSQSEQWRWSLGEVVYHLGTLTIAQMILASISASHQFILRIFLQNAKNIYHALDLSLLNSVTDSPKNTDILAKFPSAATYTEYHTLD